MEEIIARNMMSWLESLINRYCCTDSVIGIFHWHNPSGRTMALGSTHPLK